MKDKMKEFALEYLPEMSNEKIETAHKNNKVCRDCGSKNITHRNAFGNGFWFCRKCALRCIKRGAAGKWDFSDDAETAWKSSYYR